LVLQASKAIEDKALAPTGHGASVTTEFIGNLEVGRVVGLVGPQNDPAAKSQTLRRGGSADEHLQLQEDIGGQGDSGAKRSSHGSILAGTEGMLSADDFLMRTKTRYLVYTS
jgi:hypothetical protein